MHDVCMCVHRVCDARVCKCMQSMHKCIYGCLHVVTLNVLNTVIIVLYHSWKGSAICAVKLD